MAVYDFVKEACDVLIRFYDFYKTTKDDDCKEDAIVPQQSTPDGETLLSVFEQTLSKERSSLPTEFLKECSDFISFLKGHGKEITLLQTPLLYKLLAYVCGTEGRIKGNRRIFKILDDCMNISRQYTIISTGSKAEGLNIPHGDFDVMTVLEQIIVCTGNECHFEDTFPVIKFDITYAHPGFAHLTIPTSKFSEDIFRSWGADSEYGKLVSNKKFKDYFIKFYRTADVMINGPCISDPLGIIDHVFCLRSQSWPITADQWFHRTRLSSWPPIDVVSEIRDEGVMFVPKGSRISDEEYTELEWRMSFREAKLVQSFNHVQMICYTLMKYFKKDLINTIALECELSSYILKTVLFWISEDIPYDKWRPENLFSCIHAFQQRLRYLMKYRFCPHYFVPEFDLFYGVLTNESIEKLEVMITNMMPCLLQSIHYGKSFQQFSFAKLYRFSVLDNQFIEQYKAIYILLKVVRQYLSRCTFQQIHRIRTKTVSRLIQNRLSYFTKGLYALIFCYSSQILAQMSNTNLNTNKGFYRADKSVKSMLLMGAHADSMTGWLLIAMYFYRNCQYDLALFVTQCAIQKCTNDKLYISDGFLEDEVVEHIAKSQWNTGVSFLRRNNSSCVDSVYLLPASAWSIDEMKIDVGYKFGMAPPLVFAHFIQFLCHNRMKLKLSRNTSVTEMISTIQKNKFLGDWRGEFISLEILLRVYYIMKYHQSAEFLSQKLHLIWKKRRQVRYKKTCLR